MSEQESQSPPARETSGGDPHHDPTQNAPEADERTEREAREGGEDEKDSDDGTS